MNIQEYLEGRVQMGLQPQKRAVAEILGLPRRNFPPDHWDAIMNQWGKMMLTHAIELAKELAERQGSPCTEYQLRTRLKAGRTTSASMKKSKVWEEILQEAIAATGSIATPPPSDSFVDWVRCSFCIDKVPAELLIIIGATSRPMCPECFAAYRQAVKRDEGAA